MQFLLFCPSASIPEAVILTEMQRDFDVKRIQWLGDGHMCTYLVSKCLEAQPVIVEGHWCNFYSFHTKWILGFVFEGPREKFGICHLDGLETVPWESSAS